MEKKKTTRKLWFRGVKKFLGLIIKKPEFIFLGGSMEDLDKQMLFITNHVAASAPLTLELYGPHPFRFWGTFEMNSNLITVYKYLSYTYYHKKKHWNLFAARMFCLIAAPLVSLFYRGLQLISTYPDIRLLQTIRESAKVIRENQSLVIFPEHSVDGYHDELTFFHSGFLLMAEKCLKMGYDLPMYLAYLRKSDRKYIIDKPIKLSELLSTGEDREALAERIRLRINELGKMQFPTAEA